MRAPTSHGSCTWRCWGSVLLAKSYDALQGAGMMIGKSWLRLMETEAPHVALAWMRPSKEALAVMLGLLTVRIRAGAFVTLTVDPPVPVICAVPIPSRLALTLQVPGLLIESGDKVSERAAPLVGRA